MKLHLLAAACAALLTLPAAAQATVYSLSGDFSDLLNPNGPWSFTQGATPLTHFARPTTPNALNDAAANGYWGSGADFFTTPTVIKVTQDGGATMGYSDADFLTGDVIMHSVNPGTGDSLFINWTAPTAGVINFSSAIWYAHSPVTRSNTYDFFLAGNSLNVTGSVTNGVGRSNPNTVSGMGFTVAAGDVLAFRVTPTDGQQFGSLTGLSETVDFTAAVGPPGAVPEPAAWTMMLLGFGGLGTALRRRRLRILA